MKHYRSTSELRNNIVIYDQLDNYYLGIRNVEQPAVTHNHVNKL